MVFIRLFKELVEGNISQGTFHFYFKMFHIFYLMKERCENQLLTIYQGVHITYFTNSLQHLNRSLPEPNTRASLRPSLAPSLAT